MTNFITRIFDGWTKHRQFRSTVEELNSLTDRELRDLGISRYQITEIARSAVYA